MAARLVNGLLGGTVERSDIPGAPNGTHDYELRLPGRTIALEVTSTAVATVEAFWHAVRTEDWTATTKYNWSITLSTPSRRATTRVRGLAKLADTHLVALENMGVEAFGNNLPLPSEAAPAANALSKLGINQGQRLAWAGEESEICLSTMGATAKVDRQSLNRIIAEVATANAQKLARASVHERHLFVWAPWSDRESESVLMFGPPPEPPSLPEGVDVIWLAPRQPGPTVPTTSLWRVRPPEPWRSVPVRA